MKKAVGLFGTLLLCGAVAFFVSVTFWDTAAPTPVPAEITADADELAPPAAAALAMPSVVGIAAKEEVRTLRGPSSTERMGAGLAVSTAGHILTNQHVVGDSREISVTAEDGLSSEGTVIWSDETLDLAVLQIDRTDLTPATLGNSDDAVIGEAVLAIGNPLSMQFRRTVTAGIISAKNRMLYLPDSETLMENLLQTDASINPGNSGGPLINLRGEVIGINTVKATEAEGMGFAIAVNLCKPIVERIAQEGAYEQPYLGVVAYDKATAIYMEKEFLASDGICVVEVAQHSPAHIAGIRKGDILTMMDTAPISTMAQLRTLLLYHRPEDIVKLDVNRDGTLFTATVTLKAR